MIFDGHIVGEADPATADEGHLGLLMAGVAEDNIKPGPGTLPDHLTPVDRTLTEMSPKDRAP